MNYVFIMTIAEYFLWGVFRAVENNQTLNKADGEDTPFISPLECVISNDHTIMENGEAVDMEIDMVGGENVGRLDIVVSKDSSSGDIDKTRGDFALELPLQSSNGKCFTVEQLGIPPGFEKIARTKLKDTSCKGSVKEGNIGLKINF